MIAGAQGLYQGDRDDAEFELGNRGLNLEALGGLRGLRTDVPGEVAMYEDLIGQGMRDRMGGIRGNLQDRMGYNQNKGFGGYLMDGLGMVAGGLPMLLGGGDKDDPKKGSGQQPVYPEPNPNEPSSPDAGSGRQNFSRFTYGPQIENPMQRYQGGFGSTPRRYSSNYGRY